MAMKMLEAGGMDALTDGARKADEQNPNGYFELEAVKGLDKHGDASWLRDARGKAVKVVSHLLTWLPETYDYRVIFMERSLDEVIASQNKMLDDRGHAAEAGDADRAKARVRAASRSDEAVPGTPSVLQDADDQLRRRRCTTRKAAAQRIAAFLGTRWT